MADTYYSNGRELKEPDTEWAITFLWRAYLHLSANNDNGISTMAMLAIRQKIRELERTTAKPGHIKTLPL